MMLDQHLPLLTQDYSQEFEKNKGEEKTTIALAEFAMRLPA